MKRKCNNCKHYHNDQLGLKKAYGICDIETSYQYHIVRGTWNATYCTPWEEINKS